jgi:deoxynucleotidyltransferase terminal-interacting protein 1
MTFIRDFCFHRSLIQSDINSKIQDLMQDYLSRYFEPAFKNMQRNLGAENVSSKLLDEVCVNALENAKTIFTAPKLEAGEKTPKQTSSSVVKRRLKRKKSFHFPEKATPKTDLILISKKGRPVRREGDKWDPKRLTPETLFVLGSKASRALGLGGRLFVKHPSLFRYRCDHSDMEWLSKNRLISNVFGKTYLMVLKDIFELSDAEKNSDRKRKFELRGFKCPPFMIKKMAAFVKAVKTDPSVPDVELLHQAHQQVRTI